MLLRTPLYDFHIACGAKMVDFAGWEMPLFYRGITREHEQTRSSGSIFDVSHMGRFYITGPDAMSLINRTLTRNVSQQRIGQSRYSVVCNASGGVLDDVIISKDAKHWLLVCNASNRATIFKQLNLVRDDAKMDATIDDQTLTTAMVAVQGPKALDEVSNSLAIDLRQLKRYSFENGTYGMSKFTAFRSGYTGEDGVELIFAASTAESIIKGISTDLMKPDAPIQPAGLGARDTLRLEAGMPLYGHELSESLDPISAQLNWAVDLTKDFIGVEPLRVIAQHGPARKLVGLELDGPRIARQGTTILNGPTKIGEVTSGTMSPTLHKSIAMAYVDAAHGEIGTMVNADLRGTKNPAKIVPLPFYKRSA